MAFFFPSTELGANIIITQEEFNLFHNIDRHLFIRLVVSLGRESGQCTQIMAFIMWLENKIKHSQLVLELLHWPNNLLNDLAEESILALKCIESPHFPYAPDKVLPLILNISRGNLTLQNFHENRLEIFQAVTTILNDVCVRAFTDIVHQLHHERAMKQQNLSVSTNFYGEIPNHATMAPIFYYAPAAAPVGVSIVPQQIAVPGAIAQWHHGNFGTWVASTSMDRPYDDGAVIRNEANEEFKEILAKIELSGAALAREMKEVPADDRTIFMTFSKGYPISESEVREFFARTHGDIIEAIHMQDVLPTEQPLFARMVVRTEAMNMLDSFLEGTTRVKFSINGKHVWARRYVRKGNKSLQATSVVTSAPPSPSGTGTSSYSY